MSVASWGETNSGSAILRAPGRFLICLGFIDPCTPCYATEYTDCHVEGLLFFRRRRSSAVAVSAGRNNEWFARRQHDVVATDDVRKLVEFTLACLIDGFVAFDIDVPIIFHAGAGGNQSAHDHVFL